MNCVKMRGNLVPDTYACVTAMVLFKEEEKCTLAPVARLRLALGGRSRLLRQRGSSLMILKS